jgi:hypothetical protein
MARRQKSQRTLVREAADRAMRENPVGAVIFFALLIVFVMGLFALKDFLSF